MDQLLTAAAPPPLYTVARADCAYEPLPWDFADAFSTAIDDHWEAALRQQPALFDGRVLMQVSGGPARDADGRTVFRATYTDVAFRAFLAWRDLGHPVRGFRNGFAQAALRGADGGFVLGEMGPHTANGGRIYFPSGTPDLSDLVGGRVDLDGSVRRELVEETGLDPATLAFAPGFTVLPDDLRVCFMKAVNASETAEALAARIHANLAAQERPELVRMHIVRAASDITPAMPPFVAAYLRHELGLQSG